MNRKELGEQVQRVLNDLSEIKRDILLGNAEFEAQDREWSSKFGELASELITLSNSTNPDVIEDDEER